MITCMQGSSSQRPAFKRPSIQIPDLSPKPAGRLEALEIRPSGGGEGQFPGSALPWPGISPKTLPSPEETAWCATALSAKL